MDLEKRKKKRRVFTKEFKKEACIMVLEQGRSRQEVARNLGVAYPMICNWVRTFQSQQEQGFPGQGKLNPEKQEIQDLKAEIRRLKMERDILKKAIAYVADHDD